MPSEGPQAGERDTEMEHYSSALTQTEAVL